MILGQVRSWLAKLWQDFRSFTPGQKVVTGLAVVALIAGGVVFATWHTAPTYAPLYSNLSTQDAADIVQQLRSDNVPYQIAEGGTQILVPADKVYDTRLTLTSAGLPSGNSGYSLLDKEGITASDFKQQVDYQRAVEGELGNTIQALDGVKSATVHLAIPQQNVFNDGTTKTTASVLVSLQPGASLTQQQVQSIVYLVSSSVPGLNQNEVAVSDSTGRVLAAPGGDITGVAGTDARSQMTQDYNTQLSTALQSMLDKALGPGHSAVTVNADLNFDKSSTTTQKYTYDKGTPPVTSQDSTEAYSTNQQSTNGTAAPNTLGTGQNQQQAGSNSKGTYSKTDKTVANALGTVTQTVDNTPGALQKLSVAVLLDSTVPGLDQKAISALVTSAVGLDTARGDTLAIQAMPFDNSMAKAAAASDAQVAAATKATTQHEELVTWAKQGGLAAVILALLLGTILASRKRAKAAAAAAESVELDGPPMPAGALLPPPPPTPAAPYIPEPSDQIGAGRRALTALADEQPDDVARVLSGWLNSDSSSKQGVSR